MSITLLVYSSHEVLIGVESLVAELARGGWEVAEAPTYVWVGGSREVRASPLQGVLYGWPAGAIDGARIRELIARIPLEAPGARTSVESELAQLSDLTACEAQGVMFEFEPGELDEYPEIPSELLARLAKTRTQYVLRVTARQGQPAFRFQQALSLAIATVTDGVRLDPQADEWT